MNYILLMRYMLLGFFNFLLKKELIHEHRDHLKLLEFSDIKVFEDISHLLCGQLFQYQIIKTKKLDSWIKKFNLRKKVN